jgi:hypothetical protein
MIRHVSLPKAQQPVQASARLRNQRLRRWFDKAACGGTKFGSGNFTDPAQANADRRKTYSRSPVELPP